jgi:hypothetical protein
VVYLLQGLGIETGIDLDRLIAAGQRISAGPPTGSRVARARSAAESHRCHMVWVECYRPHRWQQKSGNRETNRQNFRCQIFTKSPSH